MNNQEVAKQFREKGYAIARGVFSKQEIAQIERQLADFVKTSLSQLTERDLYYEETPEKPIKAIHNLEKYSSEFDELSRDERLLRLMQTIWPEVEIVPHGVMYFGKAARSGSVAPAHQDNAFQNMQPPEDLVCTIAIDESTPANGVLCVQERSHLAGRLSHRPSGAKGFSQTLVTPLDKGEYPEVQLCMQPGDICLHHINTVHYSGPNTTDKSRRQVGIGYRTARAKRDEGAWAKYQEELKSLLATPAATM